MGEEKMRRNRKWRMMDNIIIDDDDHGIQFRLETIVFVFVMYTLRAKIMRQDECDD